MKEKEFNLSEKIDGKGNISGFYVKEFIKRLDDGCVICKEFRDWENERKYTHQLTTELEKFIYWFKTFKLKRLAGSKLS